MKEELRFSMGSTARFDLQKGREDFDKGVAVKFLQISTFGSNLLKFEVIKNGQIVQTSMIPVKFILNFEEMLEKSFLYLDSVVRA
jgi:hypothetical protein